MLWRRSYDTPPPPIERGSEYDQAGDPRYAGLPSELLPRTECLKDVVDADAAVLVRRDRPGPAGRQDRPRRRPRQLAARPGQAPRRDLRRATIVGLNIPTGIPLLYELDEDFHPVTPGGEYLDPQAAKDAIEAVKNQGR